MPPVKTPASPPVGKKCTCNLWWICLQASSSRRVEIPVIYPTYSFYAFFYFVTGGKPAPGATKPVAPPGPKVDNPKPVAPVTTAPNNGATKPVTPVPVTKPVAAGNNGAPNNGTKPVTPVKPVTPKDIKPVVPVTTTPNNGTKPVTPVPPVPPAPVTKPGVPVTGAANNGTKPVTPNGGNKPVVPGTGAANNGTKTVTPNKPVAPGTGAAINGTPNVSATTPQQIPPVPATTPAAGK